jgi:hypothetical protein
MHMAMKGCNIIGGFLFFFIHSFGIIVQEGGTFFNYIEIIIPKGGTSCYYAGTFVPA